MVQLEDEFRDRMSEVTGRLLNSLDPTANMLLVRFNLNTPKCESLQLLTWSPHALPESTLYTTVADNTGYVYMHGGICC